MTYWPGTKIVKSENNAFTSWKKPRQTELEKRSFAQQLNLGGYVTGKKKLEVKRSFIIYSRA